MVELILDVCIEYGFAARLGYLIIDNTTNNDSMVKFLAQLIPSIDPAENRLHCLAHVINLAARAFINGLGPAHDPGMDDNDDATVPEPIVKVLFGIHYIRRSPLRRTQYRNAADDLELPDVTLVPNNKTRFNSVCKMIHSALPQHLAIDQFMWEEQFEHPAGSMARKQLRKHLLTAEDWRELEVLYRLLKPFKSCTLATEGMHSPLLQLTDL